MALDHHFDASTRPSPSRRSEDEGKVPRVPVADAGGRTEGLTPNEWVDAWIEAGGSFHRDGEHFLVGRPVSGSERLLDLMRAVGDLPTHDGRWLPKRRAFNRLVVEEADWRMDELGVNVLIDREAWLRHARPL